MLVIAVLMFIVYFLRSYYVYKFLIIEEFKSFSGNPIEFAFSSKFEKHKIYSISFYPLFSKANLVESAKSKTIANILLIVFYALLILLIIF